MAQECHCEAGEEGHHKVAKIKIFGWEPVQETRLLSRDPDVLNLYRQEAYTYHAQSVLLLAGREIYR